MTRRELLEAKVDELRRRQSHDIVEWLCTVTSVRIDASAYRAVIEVDGRSFKGIDARDALAQACQALRGKL